MRGGFREGGRRIRGTPRINLIGANVGRWVAGGGKGAGVDGKVADGPGSTTKCKVDFAKVAVEPAIHHGVDMIGTDIASRIPRRRWERRC